MSDLVAALDRALADRGSEDITLRRVVGTAPNQTTADVICRAKVIATGQAPGGPGGVALTNYDVIISPTQIREKQWPGGDMPKVAPFDRDQSIPMPMTDKILMRGQPPIAITHVDPVFVAGELVRINMKATG
jgi:hypothetical protein